MFSKPCQQTGIKSSIFSSSANRQAPKAQCFHSSANRQAPKLNVFITLSIGRHQTLNVFTTLPIGRHQKLIVFTTLPIGSIKSSMFSLPSSAFRQETQVHWVITLTIVREFKVYISYSSANRQQNENHTLQNLVNQQRPKGKGNSQIL